MGSTALTWAIYAMCKHPEVQEKLRDEINEVPSDSPTFDEVSGLRYLDAVVRETLRVHSPVMGTSRVAAEDCVIPLSEPITDSEGVKRYELL